MVINILDAARPTLLSQPLIDAPCSSIAKGELPIAVGSSASNVPHLLHPSYRVTIPIFI